MQRRAGDFQRAAQAFFQAGVIRRIITNALNLVDQRGEGLAEAVVQFARQAPAFLFLDAPYRLGQATEALFTAHHGLHQALIVLGEFTDLLKNRLAFFRILQSVSHGGVLA